jgi:hypothetical protein
MKRRLLLGYQLLIGFSDGVTGLLLLFSPVFTLRLMSLEAPSAALPFLSWIGAFVLSTGIACLYGGFLVTRPNPAPKLEVVWILTALTRGLVAAFIVSAMMSGALKAGWITVAISDGALALIQGIGLFKGWPGNAGD